MTSGTSLSGKSGNLPTGTSSFASPKQITPLAPGTPLSGKSVDPPSGTFPFAGPEETTPLTSRTPLSSKSGNLPTDTFSFASPKETTPLISGTSGNLQSGTFSLPGSTLTVPSTAGTSSSGTSGNPSAGAFSFSSDKQSGPIPFKPTAQVQATESGMPSRSRPPLVKPTPITQLQPDSQVKTSFQPAPTTAATSIKAPSQPQVLHNLTLQ